MLVKTGHSLHLKYVFSAILVVKTLDSQYMVLDSIYWVASSSQLFQPFIQLKLIKWVPGTPGNWVAKSKLSPHSGYVALRQLNPIHKKEL